MTDARTHMVGAGYDSMVDTWESWKAQIADDPRGDWCDDLIQRLGEGARVLELGCGGGTAETKALSARFSVTGVDLSEAQLERARSRVPRAEFRLDDFTGISFHPGSFDAVTAFYSFNHVPRELLAGLFARIHSWLLPDGFFLGTLGASDLEGWTGEWLGVPMYFSGWAPETNRKLIEDAGFSLERDEIVTIEEPEGPVAFHWVLARR